MEKLATKSKNALTKSKKLSQNQSNKLTLIDHIESVVEHAENSKLSVEFYKNVKVHADYIGNKLELNPVQSLLISLFMDKSDNCRIELRELSKYVGCPNIKIIGLMNELDVLAAKRYLLCRSNEDGYYFRILKDFVDFTRKEIPYIPIQYTHLDKYSLFFVIKKLLKLRDKEDLLFDILVDDLIYMVENNKHIKFCKKIVRFKNDRESFAILILFCSLLINYNANIICLEYELRGFIEDCTGEQEKIMREMSQGKHFLMSSNENMVEFSKDSGFQKPDFFQLTKKAKEELLSDYHLEDEKIKLTKEFIHHNLLIKKDLYYNDR